MTDQALKYDNWPKYIKKRHALTKIELGSGKTSYRPQDPTKETRNASDVVDWLYSVLTILDSKASALMTVNSVLIAVAALLLSMFDKPDNTALSPCAFYALLTIASFCALSIFVCLLVVDVRWSFLGKVDIDTNDGTIECHREISALDSAMMCRQSMYRLAWALSLVASIIFVAVFAMQILSLCAKPAGVGT
jgi:hypothetical protein